MLELTCYENGILDLSRTCQTEKQGKYLSTTEANFFGLQGDSPTVCRPIGTVRHIRYFPEIKIVDGLRSRVPLPEEEGPARPLFLSRSVLAFPRTEELP